MVLYLNLASTSKVVTEGQAAHLDASAVVTTGKEERWKSHSKKTKIVKKHHPLPKHLEHHHLKRLHSAPTALHYLVASVYGHHDRGSLPHHLLFTESNFRHDNVLFLNRQFQIPVWNSEESAKKLVANNRLMHETAIWFGAGTAKKMLALLGKITVKDELHNTIITAIAAAGGAQGSANSTNFIKEIEKIQELEYFEVMKHVTEGTDLDYYPPNLMKSTYAVRAKDILDKYEWQMTHIQYVLNEFHSFISAFRSENHEHFLGNPVSQSHTEGILRTVYDALQAA